MVFKIGSKPSHLNDQVDSPNLWTSVGLLSSQLSNLSNQYDFNLKKVHKEAKDEALKATEAASKQKFNQLNGRIDLIEKHLLQISTNVQELMENQEIDNKTKHKKRASLRKTNDRFNDDNESMKSYLTSSSESSQSSRSSTSDEVSEANEFTQHNTKSKVNISRLQKLETEVDRLKSLNDLAAIAFCALGFRSRDDSDNWLMKYSPKKDFGYVVDVHTVCEHLQAQLFGKDSTLGNHFFTVNQNCKT